MATITIRKATGETIQAGEFVYASYRPRVWWKPWTWFGARWEATAQGQFQPSTIYDSKGEPSRAVGGEPAVVKATDSVTV